MEIQTNDTMLTSCADPTPPCARMCICILHALVSPFQLTQGTIHPHPNPLIPESTHVQSSRGLIQPSPNPAEPNPASFNRAAAEPNPPTPNLAQPTQPRPNPPLQLSPNPCS